MPVSEQLPPTVRFDALRRPDHRSFALGTLERVLEAHVLGDVVEAIDAAERAVGEGRWVAGWVSYEAAPAFDRALRVRPCEGTVLEGLPLAWFGVFGDALEDSGPSDGGPYELSAASSQVGAETHTLAVERVRSLIADGQTYQVNLTLPLTASFGGDVATLYRDLTVAQRAGFCALLDTGRWAVLSVSPELFFRWDGTTIECRPMKGTTARGRDEPEDEANRRWLEASEKNRAENLMIVDMVRNDIGRIARTGSVTVDALFTPERYETLWQLTSTVRAETQRSIGLADVFRALFPSASVTGAPKVATMEIIGDLEPEPRGVYCGAVGFGRPGPGGAEWTFSVAIRTLLIDRRTGTARYGTGGGVTYDSAGVDEYAEALLKAEVLRRRTPAGLFETMRWDPATGFRSGERHVDRLAASARYFDIPVDRTGVVRALEQAVAGRAEPTRVRLEVDCSGRPSVAVSALPDRPAAPVQLAVDSEPVDPRDPLLRHKTTLRAAYEGAQRRHPAADDVILVNDAREITETTIANVAVLLDGRWVTPPIDSGCLPGIERAIRLESGELSEAVVTLADLQRADGVARLNSLRGWEPCVLLPGFLRADSPRKTIL